MLFFDKLRQIEFFKIKIVTGFVFESRRINSATSDKRQSLKQNTPTSFERTTNGLINCNSAHLDSVLLYKLSLLFHFISLKLDI